jgi:hypothetical protein
MFRLNMKNWWAATVTAPCESEGRFSPVRTDLWYIIIIIIIIIV